jgi:hypothetical protein
MLQYNRTETFTVEKHSACSSYSKQFAFVWMNPMAGAVKVCITAE